MKKIFLGIFLIIAQQSFGFGWGKSEDINPQYVRKEFIYVSAVNPEEKDFVMSENDTHKKYLRVYTEKGEPLYNEYPILVNLNNVNTINPTIYGSTIFFFSFKDGTTGNYFYVSEDKLKKYFNLKTDDFMKNQKSIAMDNSSEDVFILKETGELQLLKKGEWEKYKKQL
ncbi:hypothetical protein [Cetobacterium sp. SF1]|uniref:hypothetical protein n=1 Tax=unclassified Cetobacterium TaxID=2630983 RepID=UPI003CEEA2EE